ncbi:MAG: UPF0058 family protein [Candidatus Thermoplasmatota archaeon]|nr:UPF0058 family protein [Candidatus Thermoplasmatota archaeon]
MQKDELVQIHSLLLQIRQYLEITMDTSNVDVFSSYDDLDVKPQQIFKQKQKQMLAIFELCRGMEQLFDENGSPFSQAMSMRLEGICHRLRSVE